MERAFQKLSFEPIILTIDPNRLLLGLFILVIAILGIALLFERQRKTVDARVRLNDFLESVRSLSWESGAVEQSLDKVADAVRTMVQAEIGYYYRTRKLQRSTSMFFRSAGFVFGTIGILCPLIEATDPRFAGLGRLGFVLLALAAACFAGNELFGGTRGHIRSVRTQYRLESLLTDFVLDWCRWHQQTAHRNEIAIPEDAFAALKTLCDGVYQTIQDETKEWAIAIVEAESAFSGSLSRRNGQ